MGSGDTSELEGYRFKVHWPGLLAQLRHEALNESREGHVLRNALSKFVLLSLAPSILTS